MATSGTVGATKVDVVSIIEMAIRRCGVPSTVISGEQMVNARQTLFMQLSKLLNRGISLFAVQKYVFSPNPGQARYQLPIGTSDILGALLRYGSTAAATTLAVNLAQYAPATATPVSSVTVTVQNAGDYSLVLECSQDNATWTQVGALLSTGVAAGAELCIDADPVNANLFWRVREIVAVAAVFTAAQFLFNATEITMSLISRDDYLNYPNKTFQSLNPLQFWFDKQVAPAIVVWPVPQDNSRQISLWTQRQIQDPGQFYNTLQIPDRWLESIVSSLAETVCLELPPQIVPPGRYEILVPRAAAALIDAENGETDGAPVKVAPNISCYTR